MTNGSVDTAAEVELHMDRLSYKQVRQAQKDIKAHPDDAQDLVDDLLRIVVDDFDDLSFLAAVDAFRRFSQTVEEGFQGKGRPPAPSSEASGVGESTTTAT